MARNKKVGPPTDRDLRILKKLEELIVAKERTSPDHDIMLTLHEHFGFKRNELREALDRLRKSGHYAVLEKKFKDQNPPESR